MGMKLKFGWNRRSFLAALGTLTGGMFAPSELSAAFFGKKPKPSARAIDGNPILPIKTGLGSTGDIYAELGVTPIININGTLTVIGGSVMKPEVMELIRRGNEHCVSIDELEIAAGKFIAKLCKPPVGYTGLVTAGAAAAMVVGYAGMMTEDLEPRMRDIPDVSNFPRNEVVIQKSHRYPFDHQIRQTGAKLVEVETREEMIAAISAKNFGHSLYQYPVRQRKGQRPGDRGNRQGAQRVHLQRCRRGRAAERADLGISGLGLRHVHLQRRQGYPRTAGFGYFDRERGVDPLRVVEHEPAGGSHWALLQSRQGDHSRPAQGARDFRQPGFRCHSENLR